MLPSTLPDSLWSQGFLISVSHWRTQTLHWEMLWGSEISTELWQQEGSIREFYLGFKEKERHLGFENFRRYINLQTYSFIWQPLKIRTEAILSWDVCCYSTRAIVTREQCQGVIIPIRFFCLLDLIALHKIIVCNQL